MTQGRPPVPLTDEQIEAHFGQYITDRIERLATDLSYIEAMATNARRLESVRTRLAESRQKKAAARGEKADTDARNAEENVPRARQLRDTSQSHGGHP